MKHVLIFAGVLAFAAKVVLALLTYGTNDVLTWEADVRILQTKGAQALYREGARPTWHGNPSGVHQRFNHPPFMTRVLLAWARVADATGVPFRAWLRLTSALADIGMLWLVWRILRAENIAFDPPVLLGLALSPVSILVSGFHGNTDPVMVCFLLLSIYLIATRRPAWLAGAAFGMAMNIKVVPIVFLPAILLYLSSIRRRTMFAVSTAAVFVAGSMPYLAQDPALIIRSVFGYNPGAGLWGFPLFALLISEDALARYLMIGKFLAPGAALLAAVWIHLRAPRVSLFRRCGFVAFLFLFLASGFGMQYLAWLVPWSAALSWRSVRWHYAVAGANVFLFYAEFSRWGWHIANTFNYSPRSIAVVGLLQIACWVSVGSVAVAFARSIFTKATIDGRMLSEYAGQSAVQFQ